MNKYSYCATMIAAILSTTTMANASSLAISVANDDAGIFQPSLNALYGHKAADRGDYTAGLFLGYSHDLTDASQLSFISRKIFILHQVPIRESLKPSKATARSAPFFIPDWSGIH